MVRNLVVRRKLAFAQKLCQAIHQIHLQHHITNEVMWHWSRSGANFFLGILGLCPFPFVQLDEGFLTLVLVTVGISECGYPKTTWNCVHFRELEVSQSFNESLIKGALTQKGEESLIETSVHSQNPRYIPNSHEALWPVSQRMIT